MLMDEEGIPDDDDDINYTNTATPKLRSKSRKKKDGVKTEDGAEESQSDGEPEGDENVFIDNLPKDEHNIKILLKEVNKHIRELERQFFEEEDSEVEKQIQ